MMINDRDELGVVGNFLHLLFWIAEIEDVDHSVCHVWGRVAIGGSVGVYVPVRGVLQAAVNAVLVEISFVSQPDASEPIGATAMVDDERNDLAHSLLLNFSALASKVSTVSMVLSSGSS